MDDYEIKKMLDDWGELFPGFLSARKEAKEKRSIPIPAVPMEIEKPIPINSRFEILDL